MRNFIFVWIGLALVSAPVAASEVQVATMTVTQALQLAEAASPDLHAALDHERAETQDIAIEKAAYYPTFSAEAIDSYGFPGSSGALGLTGLIGSPYRKGPAMGVTSSLDLFDWRRGYRVQSAKDELRAAHERTNVLRFQVDQMALKAFLDAARYRGQEEAARVVVADVMRVQKEVNRYVSTGQRSVVERLLVQDQTTEASMRAADYHERFLVAWGRLALLTQQPLRLICPRPDDLSENDLGLSTSTVNSPLLAQAAAEAASAHSEVSVSAAQNWPTITATGSVGEMDQSRLVDKREYAGAFGVSLPLFEGYRIAAETRRASALASERDHDLLAAQFDLDDENAQYEELIRSARVRLQYLGTEQQNAQQAFALAKKRYQGFEGTLVDVREALRNLERVETELIDVKTDLLLAVGAKALLNGATSDHR